MPKRRVGRPDKITPLIVSKLEEAASVDASISEMCFHAGISRQTFYTWTKKDPKLLDRLEALREKPALQARLALCRAMAKDSVDASKWYLERKRKKEFSTLQEIESTGKLETTDPATELLRNDIAGLNQAVVREMAEIAKLQKALKAKPRKK